MTDEANISPPSPQGPPPVPTSVLTPVPVLPLGYADGLGRVLPPPGKLSFPQQAARASWIAPCIALGLGVVSNSVLNNGHPRGSAENTAQMVVGGVTVLMIVTGLVLGVIALFSVRRHGREKILTPAIVGVCINGVMVGLLAMGVLFAISIAKRTRARAAALAPASSISVQEANESITKSPGWVGQVMADRTRLVVASVGPDTPMGREIKDDFATDGLAMLVMIDNSAGRETMAVDASDFSVILNDGSTRPAVSPETLLQHTRFDKRQLMAAYPWTAAIPAGTAGFRDLIAILPPGVGADQIDRVVVTHDDKRIAIIGRVLTVEEKAANVAQAQAANSPPPAP
jgi:hypothetical protein